MPPYTSIFHKAVTTLACTYQGDEQQRQYAPEGAPRTEARADVGEQSVLDGLCPVYVETEGREMRRRIQSDTTDAGTKGQARDGTRDEETSPGQA